MTTTLETDVVVVGAGPCGITLANLLGTYGVASIVVDREMGIFEFPRAVGIDDESLRTYQAVGLVNELLADIVQNTPIRYYTSWGRCFAHVKPTAKPFGWPRRNLFLQPLLEATLRRGVERLASIDLRLGWELEDLEQDSEMVTARFATPDGEPVEVRSRYLVGADGGRSLVRRLVGIDLTGKTAPAKWLVVDVADDVLDAPYSAVYCSPVQPVLVVPLPYRHRRFEWLLQPDDDEEEVTQPDRVLGLLARQYGAAPLPTILRSRVYLHHSRVATSFQRDRVFLAGDAAHLQPPFFGQGMNSGIRDATNLAWKLAAVVDGRASDSVLASYDVERRGHATQMVQFATRIGAMYKPHNLVTERLRDVLFRALQLLPGGQEYILQMKYKPMPRYEEGIVVRPTSDPGLDDLVGRMFMQPTVETTEGRERAMLDDVLGPWFAVIGVHVDPAAALDADSMRWWSALGARFFHVLAARSGPHPTRPAPPGRAASATASESITLEDVNGEFRDWLLARPHGEIVVLRPDRYVAAVCDRASFGAATSTLRALLEGNGA
jgi:3-(3-hydroxy-phenyl)propionate hydroxylase